MYMFECAILLIFSVYGRVFSSNWPLRVMTDWYIPPLNLSGYVASLMTPLDPYIQANCDIFPFVELSCRWYVERVVYGMVWDQVIYFQSSYNVRLPIITWLFPLWIYSSMLTLIPVFHVWWFSLEESAMQLVPPNLHIDVYTFFYSMHSSPPTYMWPKISHFRGIQILIWWYPSIIYFIILTMRCPQRWNLTVIYT